MVDDTEESSYEIRAVILAAGKGTRMLSELPKVLHEIFGKPLLGWVLDAIDRLKNVVVIGHGADMAEEYLKKFPNSSTVLQDKQLGTGHALMCAREKLKGFKGKVFVLCGDTPLITSTSLKKLLSNHDTHGASLSVMTAIFDDPTGYGRIVRAPDGSVKEIVEEKDATAEIRQIKEVNAGIYYFNWEEIEPALDDLKDNNAQGEYYLTDIVSWAHSKGLKTQGYTIEDNWEIFGINSREHLAVATDIMRENKLKELMRFGVTIVQPSTVSISPDTKIGRDAVVYPNTFINGKNNIGRGCNLGPFAHIRGGCEIGENVKIGNFVELKNAEVKANTNISHLSYVGDATVGEGVNVGAGVITANYNSVTKTKSKTIIEDGASVGSNTVLVAPVVLGKKAFVAAGSVVTKNVEENSLAISRGSQKNIANWVKN
ncbi:bifunctional protein GlmU [Candidatus Gastranaerophilus sp. (ex Termes propinquus)]|nr:bifunctional protein GlmU [Candidatus Gastranaerophilus sp. (ex Termes propinquus)]